MGVGRLLSGAARCADDERRLSRDARLLGDLAPHRTLESIEHQGFPGGFLGRWATPGLVVGGS